MTNAPSPRAIHRNIDLAAILRYRLPEAGVVSILHRVSGALMFLLMPFIVWMFDSSVSSEASFASFTQAFSGGLAFLPGWGVKLLVWAVIGAYLVHFIAGLRHLWMDVTHRVSKEQGRGSALLTLVMSASLWLLLGAKLFGLY